MKTPILALLALGAVIATVNANSARARETSHGGHRAPHENHGSAVAAIDGWQLDAKAARPLVKDQPAELRIQLRDEAKRAITSADLARMHEEKLHLLVVDETLSDYHHVHPVENSPGNFSVGFTPRVGGRYLVFADVSDRATHTQRYLRTEVQADGPRPKFDRVIRHETVVDGYRFTLSIPHGITVADGGHVAVQVSEKNGNPVRNLEPVMGAFAHAVGFSSDLEAVLHVHPHGAEPQSKAERAGPEIAFHVSPNRPGFYRLYVQVRINGHDIFAPFGVQIDA